MMNTIGILGGMSWESTVEYYRLINESVRERCGGLHSAPILMASVDFAPLRVLQQKAQWEEAGAMLAGLARNLEQAGAQAVLIATNTMHKVAPAVEKAISIPLLHIVDPTAKALQKRTITRVALLGTRYTMEDDFYKGRLESRFGMEVLVPEAADREIVNQVIFDELCLGTIRDTSRKEYQRIVQALEQQGAQGVILGCTEIGLLVKAGDVAIPVFDTTHLHAAAAVEFCLNG